MKRLHILAATAVACALLVACAAPMPSSAELDQLTQSILAKSFRAEGQARKRKALAAKLTPNWRNRLSNAI